MRAAALLLIPGLIPEELRDAGEKRIRGAVQRDHASPVALLMSLGHGPEYYNRPQNLTPLRPAVHLEKTRKDVKRMAKGKRLVKKSQARAPIALEELEATPAPRKQSKAWASRPMPCGRNSNLKRTMRGQVVTRERRVLH